MIQMLVATLMWALVASLLIFRRKRTDRSITRAAFTIAQPATIWRAAALILMIHSALNSLFLRLRSLYEFSRALRRASFAVLNSFLRAP